MKPQLNGKQKEEGIVVASNPKPAASRLYVTPSKAASLLGVHPVTVARWVDAGKLKAFRTLGGHRRIPMEEIRKLREGMGLGAL